MANIAIIWLWPITAVARVVKKYCASQNVARNVNVPKNKPLEVPINYRGRYCGPSFQGNDYYLRHNHIGHNFLDDTWISQVSVGGAPRKNRPLALRDPGVVYIVLAYTVIAYTVTAYVVTAHVVTGYTVYVITVMAYT